MVNKCCWKVYYKLFCRCCLVACFLYFVNDSTRSKCAAHSLSLSQNLSAQQWLFENFHSLTLCRNSFSHDFVFSVSPAFIASYFSSNCFSTTTRLSERAFHKNNFRSFSFQKYYRFYCNLSICQPFIQVIIFHLHCKCSTKPPPFSSLSFSK